MNRPGAHNKKRPPPTEKEREEIYQEFRLYDKNGDGFISQAEAHAVLEAKLGFTREKTKRLLRMCDTNGDGHLSFNEFIDFFFRVKEKVQEMHALFYEFDRDGNGKISLEEAKEAFRTLCFNDDEIENLVRAYDTNDDGYLQYDEFVKFWNAN